GSEDGRRFKLAQNFGRSHTQLTKWLVVIGGRGTVEKLTLPMKCSELQQKARFADRAFCFLAFV
ncbi:hypothetical protein, partial [Azotobacter beijerinckii]|uniref:hypothetical protein n=1 Tax=Azotobacter beijerinckii TaxID=170623 RepID=UPI001ABF2EEA